MGHFIRNDFMTKLDEYLAEVKEQHRKSKEPRDHTPNLLKIIEEMRGALTYYADSYTYGDGNGMSWGSCAIQSDRGEIARSMLKRCEEIAGKTIGITNIGICCICEGGICEHTGPHTQCDKH